MSKQELIEKTINALQKLSAEKVAEVSDFTEFILQRSEDKEITTNIGHLSAQTKSYQFLEEEEELYTLNDVKAPYNGKGWHHFNSFSFYQSFWYQDSPRLVLIDAEYDVTVSFITTQTGRNDHASVSIKPTKSNGLKKESFIRLSKLATIDKELIIGKIGGLNTQEMLAVNQKLKEVFQL